MTKAERENTIEMISSLSIEVKDKLYNMVWENQEGQEEHFDKLNKAERVALVGLLNNACNLVQSIEMYKSWFMRKI